MQTENPFLYNLLTPYDQIKFVNAFKTGLKILGKEKCWCMKKIKHSAFEGFNTSKKNKLQYQGKDARELLLYLTGREPKDESSVIVRKVIVTLHIVSILLITIGDLEKMLPMKVLLLKKIV